MTASILELRSVRGTGGGPEKTILLGAAQHDRRRFAITVCYVRDLRDDVFGIDDRAQRMDIDYVEVRERHSFDPAIWAQLRGIVRERRIDIVHGHDYKTNLLAYLLARRTGAIAMATSHGWSSSTARERYVYYPAERKLLTRFPRVIAVSSDVRRQLIKAGADPTRVTVLLNGIDPSSFRRADAARQHIRQTLGYRDDEIVVGAIGRLERQKRFDILLEAFAELGRDRPRLRLAIVGDGSLRATLEAASERLGLGTTCRFLGHRLDIADLHSGFDLFVQSSEYEGTPNAVLEAMAMGTPLVATNAGGTSELAFDGVHGLIVPINDVHPLVSAIGSVLDEPRAAKERAVAARTRIEHDLSFGARTRTLEALYDRVLAEHGRVSTTPGHANGAPYA